jgi:hypothetical protein
MGGFSTPQSNKRTAGLPSPHPIDLQSRCSAPPCSLPLRLHQVTAPHRIHAPPPGSPLLRPCWALTPCRINALLGPPPLRHCWAPAVLGTTGSTPCMDPHLLGHAGSTPLGPQPLSPLPLGQSQAPALEAFQITAPPGSYSACH